MKPLKGKCRHHIPKNRSEEDLKTGQQFEAQSDSTSDQKPSKLTIWKDTATFVQSIFTIAGLTVGGVWAVYVFYYQNTFLPRHQLPSIEASCSLKPVGLSKGRRVLESTFHIQNTSQRRIYLLSGYTGMVGLVAPPGNNSFVVAENLQYVGEKAYLLSNISINVDPGGFLDPQSTDTLTYLLYIPKNSKYDAIIQSYTYVTSTDPNKVRVKLYKSKQPGNLYLSEIEATNDGKHWITLSPSDSPPSPNKILSTQLSEELGVETQTVYSYLPVAGTS